MSAGLIAVSNLCMWRSTHPQVEEKDGVPDVQPSQHGTTSGLRMVVDLEMVLECVGHGHGQQSIQCLLLRLGTVIQKHSKCRQRTLTRHCNNEDWFPIQWQNRRGRIILQYRLQGLHVVGRCPQYSVEVRISSWSPWSACHSSPCGSRWGAG